MTKIIDIGDHRGPGRKRRPGRQPSRFAQARRERFNAAVDEFTAKEAVYKAVRGDTLEALYVAREAVAREAASLLFERLRSVPASREAARISSRRVAALAEVARLTLAIARSNPGDPSPERMQRVMASLREEVEGAAKNVLDDGTVERLLTELRTRVGQLT